MIPTLNKDAWGWATWSARACLMLTIAAGVSCLSDAATHGSMQGDGPVGAGVAHDALLLSTQTELFANDEEPGDRFGQSVALSEDTAVVGAPFNVANGIDSGSAYVFVRNGSTWMQQQKLSPNDGLAGDLFGYSVALSGDTAIVGAWQDANGPGAAYVFVRNGSSWSLQQKLLPNGGAAYQQFGFSVGLSGDTAVVGAPRDNANGTGSGSAYVFERSGSSWSLQQKLAAGDGTINERIGSSIALSGNTVVVGNDNLTYWAYVFVRFGSTWSFQQKLVPVDDPIDPCPSLSSVAISGDTVIVGARCDTVNGLVSGTAFVYTRSNSSWSQQQKLVPKDPSHHKLFGSSVAISEEMTIVGASGDPSSGSIYTFARADSTWSQQQKLRGNDALPDDEFFGESVAFAGQLAAVGAPGASIGGRAYIMTAVGHSCATATDCASGHCSDGFCCNVACDSACDVCSAAYGATANGICTQEVPESPSCLCERYDDGTLCGVLSCEQDSLAIGTCNGNDCVEAFRVPCNGFTCDETEKTCKTACTRKADCAKGYACNNGLCVPSSACESVDDCVPPYVCDAKTRTCVLPGSWPTPQAGCDCATLANNERPRTAWLLVLGLAGAIVRRRRNQDAQPSQGIRPGP